MPQVHVLSLYIQAASWPTGRWLEQILATLARPEQARLSCPHISGAVGGGRVQKRAMKLLHVVCPLPARKGMRPEILQRAEGARQMDLLMRKVHLRCRWAGVTGYPVTFSCNSRYLKG